MASRIKLLVISQRKLFEHVTIPKEVEVTYFTSEELAKQQDLQDTFEVTVLDQDLGEKHLEVLERPVYPYTLFYTKRFLESPFADIDSKTKSFCVRKHGTELPEDHGEFVKELPNCFWRNTQGGFRVKVDQIQVQPSFLGEVFMEGYSYMVLRGAFRNSAKKAVNWSFSWILQRDEDLEIWLEYVAGDHVKVTFCVDVAYLGAEDEIVKSYFFPEDRLKKMCYICNRESAPVVLMFSLQVHGQGELRLGPMHLRTPRNGHGIFLPGGKRVVDSKRQEIAYYLDPQDGKPPLNVYFSGYRTAEGFEAHDLMRSLGAPFLLISDPRLEGGAFYMGDGELEEKVTQIIAASLIELGFTTDQMLMCGLSMGTFGALYYSTMIQPHGLILGKPLISLGTIAKNERLLRPEGFPTSLDVLLGQTGGISNNEIRKLNQRIWKKIRHTDYSRTTLAIAYMIHDDYDSTAYRDLIEVFSGRGVQIYGKGLRGRHNDDTGGIVEWFVQQIKKFQIEDFGREDR